MAQDIYFIPLDAKVDDQFDRALVTGILSRGATKPVDSYECVYPDGSRGEAHGIGSDTTQKHLNGLGFVHFGGRTLMERIFELADTLEVFLVWTDVEDPEPAACVTRPERMVRVAEDIRADLNMVVARDASHLNQLVKGDTFEENGW